MAAAAAADALGGLSLEEAAAWARDDLAAHLVAAYGAGAAQQVGGARALARVRAASARQRARL